jgi:hypothetical protein
MQVVTTVGLDIVDRNWPLACVPRDKDRRACGLIQFAASSAFLHCARVHMILDAL